MSADLRPAVEADLDTRLVELWLAVEPDDILDATLLGCLIRLAYVRGYCDSQLEDGSFLSDHGYQLHEATA